MSATSINNRFLVYKSSAGSGKTYTLVKEYLKLVLADPELYKNILAITFTNKAADEMKQRILKNLKEIADPENYADKNTIKIMLPQIVEEIQLPLSAVSQNAKIALQNILHHYNDFSISTIDSFVQRIIRSFAYDLNIPVSFDISLDVDEMIEKAVDFLLERIGLDDQLTKVLIAFAIEKLEDQKSWNIERDLTKSAAILKNEEDSFYLDKLSKYNINDFIRINENLRNYLSTQEKYLHTIAVEAGKIIKQQSLQPTDFYRAALPKYFQKIASCDFSEIEPSISAAETIYKDRWTAATADKTIKTSVLAVAETLRELFFQIQSWKEKEFEKYIILKNIRTSFSSIAVLNEIKKEWEAIKIKENILPISDFNRIISKIVLQESSPFIYERIGAKYIHFLIDEFQDTSVLQWQNLIPLVENSLSNGNMNLIVGDGKQAIYRFRNGEVEQFSRLPEIFNIPDEPFFKEKEDVLQREYNEKQLEYNYRSTSKIIDFNNDFFGFAQKYLPDYLKKIYTHHHQKYNKNQQGGGVHIEFIEKISASDFEQKNHEAIIRTVEKLLQQNYKQKDIAVLCRRNNEASSISAFLLNNGYNVISQESLLLSYSPHIHLLITAVELLLHPADEIVQASLIGALARTGKISTQQAHNYFVDNTKNNFLHFLESYGYTVNTAILTAMPLYKLIETLIQIFQLNKYEDAYLQYFLDFVLAFVVKNKSGLREFLEYWNSNKNKESIKTPEGIDAICVQTIHKAKGLEFPVVIYPFANEKIKETVNKFWIAPDFEELENVPVFITNNKTLETISFSGLRKKEEEKSFLDLLNLFYVATTRPVEQLYIFSEQKKKPGSINNIPILLIEFLKDKQYWQEDKFSYEL